MINCFHCNLEVVRVLYVKEPEIIVEICPQCEDSFTCVLDRESDNVDVRPILEQLNAAKLAKEYFHQLLLRSALEDE